MSKIVRRICKGKELKYKLIRQSGQRGRGVEWWGRRRGGGQESRGGRVGQIKTENSLYVILYITNSIHQAKFWHYTVFIAVHLYTQNKTSSCISQST